jgi:hypothetical protein
MLCPVEPKLKLFLLVWYLLIKKTLLSLLLFILLFHAHHPNKKEQSMKEPIPETAKAKNHFIVRLPGFILSEDIGLGDIVKRVTYKMGINACDPCEKRASSLNKWLVFSSKQTSK